MVSRGKKRTGGAGKAATSGQNYRYQTQQFERNLHLATTALLEAAELLINARGAQHSAVPGLEMHLVNLTGKARRLRELLPTTEVAEPHPKVESLSLFSTADWGEPK